MAALLAGIIRMGWRQDVSYYSIYFRSPPLGERFYDYRLCIQR